MGRLKQMSSRLRPVEQKRIAVKHPPKTAEKRMRGRGWMSLRESVLIRDQYQCRQCGCVVLPKDAECDHIVPLADGGRDEMENLQTLCKTCHAEKSAAENRKRGFGW
nr:MAG TPA: HNH endonuclease [Caudoviricetes sp.]